MTALGYVEALGYVKALGCVEACAFGCVRCAFGCVDACVDATSGERSNERKRRRRRSDGVSGAFFWRGLLAVGYWHWAFYALPLLKKRGFYSLLEKMRPSLQPQLRLLLLLLPLWLLHATPHASQKSLFQFNPPLLQLRRELRRLGVVAVRIIALDPGASHVRALCHASEAFLGMRATVFRAINGTEALARAGQRLPLTTRMTLSGGRHDHMQIGASAMLGCLMSHMTIWEWLLRQPSSSSSSVLVLEEDALLDVLSTERLLVLLLELMELKEERWDILMLEHGHITVEGPTRAVGRLAMTWDLPPRPSPVVVVGPNETCHWMGTRGYLLRASGARRLLPHARALTVQVDALLGLVSTFDPAFRMYWTRASVAHPGHWWRPSTVQPDLCLKCYLPTLRQPPSFLHLLLLLGLLLLLLLVWGGVRRTAAAAAWGRTSSSLVAACA